MTEVREIDATPAQGRTYALPRAAAWQSSYEGGLVREASEGTAEVVDISYTLNQVPALATAPLRWWTPERDRASASGLRLEFGTLSDWRITATALAAGQLYYTSYTYDAVGRPELSVVERDRLVRSVVSSQALEGVDLSYEEVNSILDEVLAEPPLLLG